MSMGAFHHRGRCASASPGFVLLHLPLLSSISVCLFLPPLHAQSAIFTSTVDGKEFSTFSFPLFDRSLMYLPANMTFTGNATVTQNSLQMTPDSNTASGPQNFLVNQTGRVFFSSPFVLWAPAADSSSRHVASFSTVFRFNLYRVNTSSGDTGKGEGLAFVVASSGDGSPPAGSSGGYLGLTNASTDGDASNGFVAVELDTVKQPYDPDDNHLGLDVNGVRSTHVAPLAPLGIQLAPSDTAIDDGFYTVWIDYNGTSRHVWVYMAKHGSKPATAVLNASLDLSTVLLGSKAYFGFSASTGVQYQLNCVRMWNMTVEKLAAAAVPDAGGDTTAKKASLAGRKWKLGVAIGTLCAVLVLALGVVFIRLRIIRKKQQEDKVVGQKIFLSSIVPGLPREFDYKELKEGTNSFDVGMKLGKGGYGVVYRAAVLDDRGESMEVAVKQFSGADTKGMEDFLGELSMIHRLRHRNVVKLLGWCHQNGVLFLVYELMPNGSLDRYLFGGPDGPILGWKQRCSIVADIASALNYIHNEYDQMVIHRDIKPSNIMLDAAFNARLGDFGLARAVEQDKTAYTDKMGVAGTPGYIAPECFHTGRATRESDVFGFGAVVLEMVCSRRMTSNSHNPMGCRYLLEDVWELHGMSSRARLLEAVDPRLAGDFDQDDAERLLLLGLACCHPHPGERPNMQAVLRIVTRSAPPPDVAPSKPAFMWPVQPAALAGVEGGTSTPCTALITSTLYYGGR